MEYWFYSAANWGFSDGQLPMDGVSSLNPDWTTGTNSPTNFAGETGSIDVTPVILSTWGRMKAFYW